MFTFSVLRNKKLYLYCNFDWNVRYLLNNIRHTAEQYCVMHLMYGKSKLLTVDEILDLTYKHTTKMQNGRLSRKRIFATIRFKLFFT